MAVQITATISTPFYKDIDITAGLYEPAFFFELNSRTPSSKYWKVPKISFIVCKV
jgi:hypothetical protein